MEGKNEAGSFKLLQKSGLQVLKEGPDPAEPDLDWTGPVPLSLMDPANCPKPEPDQEKRTRFILKRRSPNLNPLKNFFSSVVVFQGILDKEIEIFEKECLTFIETIISLRCD